jgi:hypothetical protein
MGFDPTRKRVPRTSDYVFVAAAVAVCLILLGWAILG